MTFHQFDNSVPAAVEERLALKRKRVHSKSRQGFEDGIKLTVRTGIQDRNGQPKLARSLLQWFKIFFENWAVGVDQKGYDARLGN